MTGTRRRAGRQKRHRRRSTRAAVRTGQHQGTAGPTPSRTPAEEYFLVGLVHLHGGALGFQEENLALDQAYQIGNLEPEDGAPSQ